MAEILILNPSPRKASKMAKRKWGSPAQKRALAKMLAANKRARSGKTTPKRKRNPSASRAVAAVKRSMTRRANPSPAAPAKRRKRNPISLGGAGARVMTQLKDAALGGAGAVAVDLAMGQINRFLPASLQRVPGQIGLGDAVKAVATVALGAVLSKPTRGVSRKMATGALTVQLAQMMATFVPSTMRMGYWNPAPVIQGTARVGPITRGTRMGAYVGGPTPLLNGRRVGAYVPGPTPLLNGMRSLSTVMAREGVRYR